jgi:hypothetical protein
MNIRYPGPSVARMIKFLGITKAQATELKDLMNQGRLLLTLDRADEMLFGHGEERLNGSYGRAGVWYVNLGDTYADTLMFDFEKRRFLVGSWGDLVEAQPRRFA